ncbi:hypothetical protein HMPREF9075_00577 [Capnocytophaga sp. oral taxon 332 str. F0381]|nr:hypothetical protein HMPREF9075_00577 [Capnocytophaga sp. oral taxon 332 str. F0381]
MLYYYPARQVAILIITLAMLLANNMAQGFCSWFILQHLRGYRPFITIMEKEQTLKFKI